MSEGESKFREAGEKLKMETKAIEEEKAATKQEVLSQLAMVSQNKELSQMYADSATVGAENISGALPLLKIHFVGKSTTNFLANGEEPQNGYLFYKPTKEQFSSVTCHILTISKGFRVANTNGELKFNQIMGGVILDEGEYKPFIMYLNGKKLSPMWDFGKEVSPYTKSKSFPIPMFALTVELGVSKVMNDNGYSFIPKFTIERNADGTPVIITDPGEFQYFKDSTKQIEETIASLIDSKTSVEQADRIIADEQKPEEVLAEIMPTAADMPF